MTKTRCVTLGKFEKNTINEDAVIARKNMIAVSDGAGGGGLFADRWSKYLLNNLPKLPITSASELDEWIGSIWENYYNKAEVAAKQLGGMALDKFYDEGSFATLAAVWKMPNDVCQWMTYGDSVVFHYNYATKKLWHSFSSLADFNQAPYLINCKDELNPTGFKKGEFQFTKDSFVFVTSDALAHYILMTYELSKQNEYGREIENAACMNTKNSNLLKKSMSLGPVNFEKEAIRKIRKGIYDKGYFYKWIKKLFNQGVIALDDYSLAAMYG